MDKWSTKCKPNKEKKTDNPYYENTYRNTFTNILVYKSQENLKVILILWLIILLRQIIKLLHYCIKGFIYSKTKV